MATQAQLVSYVLWRLRARASGQTPMTEDSSDIEAVIPAKLGDLAARGVIYIADGDSVPDSALEWVGRLIEQMVASAYGAPEDGGAIKYAEAMLRNQQPVTPSPPLEEQGIERTGGCYPDYC